MSYQYKELDTSLDDIRLCELIAGKFDDDIHIRIHHTVLSPPDINSQQESASTTDLQQSLPADWVVHKTLQGRFLYEKDRDYGPAEASETSWSHPVTGICPSTAGTSIEGSSQPVVYEALSHVWRYGENKKTTWAYVNATEQTGRASPSCSVSTLEITEDLATTLRHLRGEKSRMLWVDMICINQKDINERSHQVRRMGMIYSLAQRVVVWLGTEHSHSKLAMSTLEHLGEQVELIAGGTWRLNAPNADKPSWARTCVALPFDEDTWIAISALVNRPWFSRVWVWQEAKLANNRTSVLQCGHDQVLLYTFGRAVWCAATKPRTAALTQALQSALFEAGDAVVRVTQQPFLHTLLHLSRKACQDPRDKFYGALGLAPPSITNQIVPDYTRAVEDVYKESCLVLSQTTGRTDFLLACDLATRSLGGATWIPDWSVPPPKFPRWHFHAYQASGNSMAVATALPGSETIELQGLRCSTVRCVQAGPSDDTVSFATTIKKWMPDNPSADYRTGESVFDAFVRTLRCNLLVDRVPIDHSLPSFTSAKRSIQKLLSNEWSGDQDDVSFPEAVNKSFITLDDGSMGTTSAATKAGDVICVVLGCPLPVILRANSSGGFHIVGTAYIHGLMDAEALLGLFDREWTVQVGTHPGWFGNFHFHNAVRGVAVEEDPRLGPLPKEWERLPAIRTPSDPPRFVRYRHRATGNLINGDPRLLQESLLARGVQIERLLIT